MSAQFPTVPPLPGVPNLARLATAPQVSASASLTGTTQALAAALGLPTTVTFGTSDLFSGLGLDSLNSDDTQPEDSSDSSAPSLAFPPYAVTDDNNNLIIEPDSVIEFEINADSTINSHPVELGEFQAFNRVQEPISIRMLMACQGQQMSRSTFLSTLQDLREGTQIVTISVPDDSYPNMVLKGFGYKKTSDRGAVTIWADTQWAEERSTNVEVSAPPTSQPQGEETQNLGSIQPGDLSIQQQAVISNPPVIPAPLPTDYQNTQPPSGDAM